MPRLVRYEAEQDGDHEFCIYDLDADPGGDLVDELANLVRQLYVDTQRLREVLQQAAVGLEPVADASHIEAAIAETVSAVVPPPGVREDRPWLDVPRNELAEVIAYLVIETVRGALVPAKRIREKEVPGQPPRGMDLLALQTNPTLRLLITEVKASEAADSPPSVVATGDDSLRGQLLKFMRRPERVLQELNWVYKHSASENQPLVGRAILLWIRRALPITIVPLLVRSLDKHRPTDFGSFRDRPSEFAPARVQFEIVRVSVGISLLAEQVYGRARSA